MISFQNDGLLDIRAMKTFGVSVKETDNPIGYFGTGFKYAIAVLLRNNCKVTVWVGTDKTEFETRMVEIRGKEFRIVCANGEELGFTTDLGKNWELWQAFRELYCNCKDEANPVISDKEIAAMGGKTTVQVLGDDFVSVYRARDSIVLERAPDYYEGGVRIHKKGASRIFYKTIRIGDLKLPAIFTYDIADHHVSLTEDRTVAWYWEPLGYIAKAILGSENDSMIKEILTAPMQTLEAELNFDCGTTPGPAFMRVMSGLPFGRVSNSSAVAVYNKASGAMYAPDQTPLNEIEKKQLEKAKAFLEGLGFPVSKDPITITNDLREGTLGCVYHDKIYLSRRVFMQGTQQVASCLLEEHLHLVKGLEDETRQMQTFLFDLVISFGEQIRGEPL